MFTSGDLALILVVCTAPVVGFWIADVRDSVRQLENQYIIDMYKRKKEYRKNGRG